MSAEQTLTSACTFVPSLAQSFPTFVSSKRSAQYRVAFSFETTDRFSLWCSFDLKGIISTARSSCVNSSEPSTSLFFRLCCGLLSHIFIRLYPVAVKPPVSPLTGIPPIAQVFLWSSVFSGHSLLQGQDVSNCGMSSLLMSSGSVWK